MKKALTLAAVDVCLGGGIMLGAGPASATPTGCSVNASSGVTVLTRCTGGTGQQRAWVNCLGAGTRYGSWVGVGQTSSTYCSAGIAGAGYQLR